MNNILELNGNCTGCGACVAICPRQAIKYKLNEEGFYSVEILKHKCIECGLCKNVCAKDIKKLEKLDNLKKGSLVSARTKNEKILKKCTSGAIAYEIGKYGVENGYKIVGVIYDVKEHIARTIIAKNLEEFERMKGSKYLQSKSDEAIQKVIEIAKKNQNEKFIIFGTPCQIYGYKKVIEQLNIKNEIIYIELFCHGVPSYLVWKKYLQEQKDVNKIENIEFRNKKYGWHNFVMKIEGNKTKYKNGDRDNFYKMFFDNIFLNKSCITCELRKNKSNADIRLGDFWGKRYSLDRKGVSAVLILTKKGREIIQKIGKKIEILNEDININECLNYQSTKDYESKYDRKKMIEQLQTNKKLKKIIKQYRRNLPNKYKIKCKIKEIVSYLPPTVKIKLASKIKK